MAFLDVDLCLFAPDLLRLSSGLMNFACKFFVAFSSTALLEHVFCCFHTVILEAYFGEAWILGCFLDDRDLHCK